MSGSRAAQPFTLTSVRRRLLTGSAWVFGARVASLFLGIVVQGLLARLLTRPEYGIYTTAFTMSLIGAAIAQMGLDRAVVRFVASSIGIDEPGGARDAIRIALRYGAIGALVIALLTTGGPGQLFADHVIHSVTLARAMPLVAGWIIATAIQSLLVESFRGMQRFSYAALLDATFVDVTSATAFALLYAIAKDSGPLMVIGIAAGMTSAAAAVAAAFLVRHLRFLEGPGHVSRSEMFEVARPLMITNLAILLLGSGVDVLVLGAFRPAATVALYGAASRLVVFVVTPFAIFSGVIPPIIAELHAQRKPRQLERALRAGATITGAPAFAVLLAFLLFGPWVLGTIFRPGYRQAAPILAILSIGRLVAVWAGSCGVTLMMTGHQKAMMKITLLSGIISVAAGIAAAPLFGAVGVACATAGAQILQNALQVILVRKRVGVWTMIYFSPQALWAFFRPRRRHKEVEDAAEQVAEALVDEPDQPNGHTSNP
jgi:O-antigen/teichoic acid export membrane protein